MSLLMRQTVPERLSRAAFFIACLLPFSLALQRVPMEVSVALISVFFVAHSALTRQWEWARTAEMTGLFTLWGYVILNTVIRFGSLDANQLLQAVLWGRFVLLYAALRFWLLPTARSRDVLSCVALAILLFLLLDGLYQYVSGFSISGHNMSAKGRLTSIMQHSNLGNLMLKVMIVVLGWQLHRALQQQARRRAWAVGGLALAMCAFIPLTAERATTLLLLLGLGVFIASVFVFMAQYRRSMLWLAVVCVGLGALIGATQTNVQKRAVFFYEQMQDFPNTVYGQIYKAAWHIWQEHPFFGVGRKQYHVACLSIKERIGVYYCDAHTHNIYLQWLAEQGVAGFALFVLAMAGIVKSGMTQARASATAGSLMPFFSLAAGAIVLFPVMLTQNIFSNWPGVLFWYSLGLAAAFVSPLRDDAREKNT